MARLLCLALCCVFVAPSSPAQIQAARSNEFEAASLHPRHPGAARDEEGDAILDPSRSPDAMAPSLLSADVTLFDLVVCAYGIADAGLQPGVMKQLPEWAFSETFHLSARIRPGATVGDMRGMLQALLKERFALSTHEETRDTPVLLLEKDTKRPLRLTPHRGTCDAPGNEAKPSSPSSTDVCGTRNGYSDGMVQVRFNGVTLDQMAHQLGGAYYMAGLKYGPLVNGTDLQGRFDASVSFARLMGADVIGGATLAEALRQDMGLTLQKGSKPLRVLMIDREDRPLLD